MVRMDFLLHSNWKFKLCWRKLSHDCFWVPYTDIGSCFQFICKLVVRAYPWVACSQKNYLDLFGLGIYSWVIKKKEVYISILYPFMLYVHMVEQTLWFSLLLLMLPRIWFSFCVRILLLGSNSRLARNEWLNLELAKLKNIKSY